LLNLVFQQKLINFKHNRILIRNFLFLIEEIILRNEFRIIILFNLTWYPSDRISDLNALPVTILPCANSGFLTAAQNRTLLIFEDLRILLLETHRPLISFVNHVPTLVLVADKLNLVQALSKLRVKLLSSVII
jgi:hypothetical protein